MRRKVLARKGSVRCRLKTMKHTAFPLFLALLLVSCAGTPATPPPTAPPPPLTTVEPPPPTPTIEPLPATSQPSLQSEPQPPRPAAEKRVISVTVENWSFSPAAITVKQGEIVELHLQGVSGTHGFSVPGLGINVPVAPGETKLVPLPTETAGTFAGRCSIPCGAGHSDMKFSVTVEP